MRERFQCLVWKSDATIQLHLYFRCPPPLRRDGIVGIARKIAAGFNAESMGRSRSAVSLGVSAMRRHRRSYASWQVLEQANRHGGGNVQPATLRVELGPDMVLKQKAVVVRAPNTPPKSKNTMTWRGVASVKITSCYTSGTDWRNGKVDKAQRRGTIFPVASDERVWDADLNAEKMIGRYLSSSPTRKPSARHWPLDDKHFGPGPRWR